MSKYFTWIFDFLHKFAYIQNILVYFFYQIWWMNDIYIGHSNILMDILRDNHDQVDTNYNKCDVYTLILEKYIQLTKAHFVHIISSGCILILSKEIIGSHRCVSHAKWWKIFCKIGMSMSKEITMRNCLQVASIIVFFLGKLISFSTCACEFIFLLSWNSHLPWK